MKLSSLMRASLLAASLTVAGASFAAPDPSMHDVYVAAEAGRYADAQAMMDQVLRDHPNSAKAHFVEAELLAKQGQMRAADAQLRQAEKLEPGLPFAKPGAEDNLRRLIATPVQTSRAVASQAPVYQRDSGMSWGLMIVGAALIAFIVFAVRFMAARQQPVVYGAGGQGGYGTAPGYGPVQGGPMPGQGGGIGSGIVGGLATGAAMGAGFVAGEALMHHFTDGDRNVRDNSGYQPPLPADDDRLRADDMGGNDFGVSDSSSWDDSGGGGGDDWN